MKSALIIGGGIVGMNLALELQGRGQDVTVAEAAPDELSASLGNAGHIATEQADPIASWATIRSTPGRLFPRGPVSLPGHSIREWLPFALRLARASRAKPFQQGRSALTSLVTQAVPAWHRRLTNLGASDLMREDGHYVVWESDGSAARGKDSWRAANLGPARIRDVTDDELSELRALGQSSVVGGVRFENTGQIADLPRLRKVSARADLRAANRCGCRHLPDGRPSRSDGRSRRCLRGRSVEGAAHPLEAECPHDRGARLSHPVGVAWLACCVSAGRV